MKYLEEKLNVFLGEMLHIEVGLKHYKLDLTDEPKSNTNNFTI